MARKSSNEKVWSRKTSFMSIPLSDKSIHANFCLLACNGCSVAVQDSFCVSRPLIEKFPHPLSQWATHILIQEYRSMRRESQRASDSMSLPLASLLGAGTRRA